MHRLLAAGAIWLAALVWSGTAGAWSWPADGSMLRPFTLGSNPYAAGQHRGIDVAGVEGSPVRAPASGVVTFAGSVPTSGRGVTILTEDGFSVTLFHLGSIGVAKGDAVAEGALVGTMGFSGEPEHPVPTVHLGIRVAAQDEGYVDPLGLLPARSAPATPPPAPAPAPSPAPASAPAPAAPAASPPATTQASPAVSSASPTSAAPAPSPAPAAPPADAAANPSAQTPSATPGAREPSPVERPDAPQAGAAARSGPGVAANGVGDADGLVVVASPPSSVDQAVRRTSVRRANGAPAVSPLVPNGPRRAVTGGARVVDDAVSRPAAGDGARIDATANEPTPTRPRRAAATERPDLSPVVVASPPLVANAPRTTRHDSAAVRLPVLRPARRGSLAPFVGLALAIAAIVVLATVVTRRAARRIGSNGAVLRHHADLLRQRDAAHRPRLHDRRRGRLCAPSAAARP